MVAAARLADELKSHWEPFDLSVIVGVSGLLAALSCGEGAESQLSREPEDRIEAVGRLLTSRGPCLLLLDNADHLGAALIEPVQRWAQSAPHLSVLVTSRVALPIREARTIPVRPLEDDEAELLLRQRLSDVGTPTELTDAALVSQLVSALDGLPLAIELAAARARAMSLEDIVGHLGERFRLLRSTGSDAPNLGYAIAWSIGQLSPTARRGLSRLTVFRSTFTLEDVEAVLGRLDDGVWILDVIETLVAASLLEHHRSERGGLSTYRLLRSVREMAAEQLGSAEEGRLRGRHAEQVAGSVSALDLHPSGELGIATIRQLDRLAPDLLHAWRWSSEHEAVLAGRLALALDGWLTTRGSVAERLAVLAQAIELIGAEPPQELRWRLLLARARAREGAGQTGSRAELDEVLRATEGHPPSTLRAVALFQRSLLHDIDGQPDEMMTALGAARIQAREAGDRVFAAVADAAWVVGCRACGRPEMEPAELDAMLARAGDELEGAGGDRQAVSALVLQLRGLAHQGRWDLAGPMRERAMRLAVREQLPFQIAHLEASGALEHEHRMELELALSAWARTVQLLDRLGHQAQAECVRSRRAWVLHHLGRTAEARRECLQALHQTAETPGPLLAYYSSVCLAMNALEAGDLAGALRHCRTGLPRVEAFFLAFGAHLRAIYALCLCRAGQLGEVDALLDRSVSEVEQSGHIEAGTVTALVCILVGRQRSDPARVAGGLTMLRRFAPLRLHPPVAMQLIDSFERGTAPPDPQLSWLRWLA